MAEALSGVVIRALVFHAKVGGSRSDGGAPVVRLLMELAAACAPAGYRTGLLIYLVVGVIKRVISLHMGVGGGVRVKGGWAKLSVLSVSDTQLTC